MKAKSTFNNRLATLKYCANLSPARVGVTEVAQLLDSTRRTAQRTLKELSEWGYLNSDGECPRGYQFNEEMRGEVWFGI